jgi:tetratricopeptide (TPR) repeat protein
MSTAKELYSEAERLKDAGQLEAAVEKLQELLTLDANHVLAHLTLAVVLGKVGRHEAAVQHAERACQLDPIDAFNFTALSVTYQRAYAGTGNTAYIRMAEDARDRAHAIEGRHPH